MSYARPSRQERLKGAAAALLVQAAIGYALITGLAVQMGFTPSDSLKLFGIPTAPPPPPEKPLPRLKQSTKKEGAASPANLRAKPSDIVAPKPVLPSPPKPIAAAPIAGLGTAPAAGAADVRGPGTGAGGIGNGTGSGGEGDGDGDGGIPPRLRKGKIKDSDFPRWAEEAGIGGRVSVRYTVEVDGRVTHCRATRSSGSAQLDAYTCQLIEQRFRFKPSLDDGGRPVPSTVVEDHEWVIHNDPAPEG